MKIRQFDKDDLAAVVALQHRCPQASRWLPDDYRRLAEEPGGLILVAEMETTEPARLLGFAAFHRVIDETELRNIAVDPDYQGRGIGKALLEEARKRLLRAGAKRVLLEVRTSNVPALALYFSVGFSVLYWRKHYYHDPLDDALVLSLELFPPAVVPSPL